MRAIGVARRERDEPDAALVASGEELRAQRGARRADEHDVGREHVEALEHVAPPHEARDDRVPVLDDVGQQAVLGGRIEREGQSGHQRPPARDGTRSIASPAARASSTAATFSRGMSSSTDAAARVDHALRLLDAGDLGVRDQHGRRFERTAIELAGRPHVDRRAGAEAARERAPAGHHDDREAGAIHLVDRRGGHELPGLDRSRHDDALLGHVAGDQVAVGRRAEAHRLDHEVARVDAGAGRHRVAHGVDLARVVEAGDERPDARGRRRDEHDADRQPRVEPEGAALRALRSTGHRLPSLSGRGRERAGHHGGSNPRGRPEVIHIRARPDGSGRYLSHDHSRFGR